MFSSKTQISIAFLLICGLIAAGITCKTFLQANQMTAAAAVVILYILCAILIILCAWVLRLNHKIRILKKKLWISSRFNRLGAITAKVAHNLNNVLSGIATYPDVLMLEEQLPVSTQQGLCLVRDSGRHASEMVRDLLIMSQSTREASEPVNLEKICKTYLESNDFNEIKDNYPHIRIDFICPEKVPDISAIYLHIERMLEKLLAFSLNELSGEKSGTVRIEIFNSRFSHAEAEYLGMTPGPCVACKISHTGPFFTLESQKQIFEPFFCSKHLGKPDRGLGLTLALFVVENHNGEINFNSDNNETSFDIYFPALPG